LIVLAGVWSPVLNKLVISQAKDSAALTKAQEDQWSLIPGEYDIDLHNDHHFYHVTNEDDVIYKGAKPEFEQYGPYIYREYDTFSEMRYDQDIEILSTSDKIYRDALDGAKTAKGLTAKFNMDMKFEDKRIDEMDQTGDGINQKLKVVNQAAFGVWWGQMQSEKWRVMIVLLFNVVNDLGRQLAETGTL
jgi:hypothetical protein